MVAIDEQYTAACFTAGPSDKTGITIHHWDDPAKHPTYEGAIATFVSGARQTSAHFVVEAGRAACLVNPDDIAWACGNWDANVHTISIECNAYERDEDYQTIAEVIKHIRSIYGDLPLYPHSHWVSTSCPGTYDLARLDALARGVKDQSTPAVFAPNPEPTPAPVDDISALADRVMAGEFGNGEQRVAALGSLYDAVQAEINRRFDVPLPAPQEPSISELADRALAGEFGNGDDRRARLGGNYDAVQAEINRRYGVGVPSQGPDISALADAVLRGEYGNGEDRRAALGDLYDAVQAEVNRRFG